MTDYTDPSTIAVDDVIANINHDFKMRGDRWDSHLVWPNVTVKALADEIVRLRKEAKQESEGLDLLRQRLREAKAKEEMEEVRDRIALELHDLLDKHDGTPGVNYLRLPLKRALEELR